MNQAHPIFPCIETLAAQDPSLPKITPLSYFDAEAFTEELQERFSLQDFEVKLGRQSYVEKKRANSYAQDELLTFTAGPIEGECYWAMSKEHIRKWLSWLLPEEAADSLSYTTLYEGFYHYIVLECLDALTNLPLFSRMSPKVCLQNELPQKLFSIAVRFIHNGTSITGYLLVPLAFQSSFLTYFTEWKSELPKQSIKVDAPILAAITVGSISISQEEFAQIEVGSCILFDAVAYQIKEQMGKAAVSISGYTLFSGSIQKNKLTIQSCISNPEPFMEEDAKKTDENPNATKKTVEELPLQVSVNLAELELSLKELTQLTPGSALTLPDNPGNLVSLRVRGKKIASGELLSLGDTIGVRILSIESSGA